MCCTTRRRRFTSANMCVLVVVFIHACIIGSLCIALTLRYHYFKEVQYLDMPSDQRLISKQASSVFCTHHRLRSTFTEEHPINAMNSEYFNLYKLDGIDPSKNLNITLVYDELSSFDVFTKGKKKDYVFNLMANSNVSLTMCGNRHGDCNDNGTFWLYLVRGKDRRFLLDQLDESEPFENCPTNICLEASMIQLRSCSDHIENDATVKTEFKSTGDYAYILFLPRQKQNDNFCSGLNTTYNIARQKFDLSQHVPEFSHTRDEVIFPTSFFILEYNYWKNVPDKITYGITVDYICDSNVTTYMGIFFFAPLALIAIVSITVMCCLERNREELSLLDSLSYERYGALRS